MWGMCCLFEHTQKPRSGEAGGGQRDGGVLSTLQVGLLYCGMRELFRGALNLLKSLMSPILVRVLLGISKPHSWFQIGDGDIGDKGNIGTCFQKQLKAKEAKKVKISSERLVTAGSCHHPQSWRHQRKEVVFTQPRSTLTAHCSCPVRRSYCSAALKPMTSACHQPSPTSSTGATSTEGGCSTWPPRNRNRSNDLQFNLLTTHIHSHPFSHF